MLFTRNRKSKSLNDVVPILRIENDIIILKDGRVAMGYEIVGSPFESLNISQYESLAKDFEGSCLALPEHYIVQKIDLYSNEYYPNGRAGVPLGDQSFFERENSKHFAKHPVLRQKSYLFIISNTITNVKHNPLSTYYASGSDKFFNKNFRKLEERILQIKQNSKAFIESMNSSGLMNATALKGEEIKGLYYQMLNMDFAQSNNPVEPFKSITNELNSLIIGETKVNVLSLHEQGNEIYYSIPNDFGIDSPYTWSLGLYLQCPHITVTSWYIDDTQAELRSLDNQKRINSALVKVSGQDAVAKYQEIDEFTLAMRQSQGRFISVSLQVVVYRNNEIAREMSIQMASDAMRSIYGAVPLVETFDNANVFFSCLPGAAGGNIRWKLMKSEEASCYANFTHEFISKRNGDYVADRFRNQVYINMFNRDLNNQNWLAIGPSGSGKSFTIGFFIIQRHERNERQIIIDKGGSYKNLVEMLNGKYFQYDPENPISFNPFMCGKDDNENYTPTDDKVSFIISLISLLWKESGNMINNIEWAILHDLVPRFYSWFNENKHGEIPNLAEFIDWLKLFEKKIKEDEDLSKKFARFDLVGLYIILEPFVKGKYAALLNSKDILDISDYKLVCFDMEKINEDKRLYPIITMLLTGLSMDTIRKFPDEIKHFSMDEAWAMLAEAMGETVQMLFRTLRKNNGSMGIITQGIDEIVKSSVGLAIINNAETKLILYHTDKSQIKIISSHLGFTEEEQVKIQSLRKNKDCREVFIKQGNDSFVFVLEVPTSEHPVLSSNPVERNHLNRLKKAYNGNIQFAVKQWEEDKRNNLLENK